MFTITLHDRIDAQLREGAAYAAIVTLQRDKRAIERATSAQQLGMRFALAEGRGQRNTIPAHTYATAVDSGGVATINGLPGSIPIKLKAKYRV